MELATRKVPLHQLTSEWLTIYHKLDAITEAGEILEDGDELLCQLAEVERQLPNKIDGYATVIGEVESYAMACSEEAKRLSQRAARWAKQAEWLRGRVYQAMKAMGIETIKTAMTTVKIVKNGGMRPLLLSDEVKRDPAAAPEGYVVWEQVASVDKDKVRKVLESGSDEEKVLVEKFASLGERGERLKLS